MIYILTTIIAGVSLAFSGEVHQTFYIPKLMVFLAGSFFGITALLQRDTLVVPTVRVIAFLAVAIAGTFLSAVLSPAPRHALLQSMFIASGFISYWLMLNLEENENIKVLKVVVGAALFQVAVIALQCFNNVSFLSGPLLMEGWRLTGTVGNPEFLSTLFAAAFFFALHLREKAEIKVSSFVFYILTGLLILGTIATGCKGTLFFMLMYGLWRWKPNFKVLGLSAFLLVLFAGLYSPGSIIGRIFLWIVGVRMFVSHPLFGVGLNQFENNYLETVYGLFRSWPGLSAYFGGYTSVVRDAHNIFIQQAAELGLVGLALSIIFASFLSGCVKSHKNYLGAAALLLLYKSFYTVMLNSPTGLLLVAILAGVLTSANECRRVKVRYVWVPIVVPVLAGMLFFGLNLCLADYYYQKGLTYLLAGDGSGAATEFEASRKTDPENSEACLGLAYQYFLNGRKREMSSNLQNAIRLKKNMDTLKISAHMYFYSSNYTEAKKLYEYLHFVFPEHLTSMGKLAIIAAVNNDPLASENLAKEILNTSPRRLNNSDASNVRIAREILNESSRRF